MPTPAKFANDAIAELNDTFEADADYIEALEELIDQAQACLAAKKEEMERDEA